MRLLTTILFVSIVLFSCSSQEEKIYSLSVTAVPQEGGTVTPETGVFDENRTVEISATPNQHWIFDKWEGDFGGSENPVVITMDSHKDIAAIFIKRDYPLTILIEGEGTVSEEVVSLRTTDYEHDTTVQLTANPEPGWEFHEWQGDAEGNENQITVTIDGETEITAVFTPVMHTVTISIEGEGHVIDESGNVVSDTTLAEGSVIELTAVADDNWIFSDWSGDKESSEKSIEITVNGPTTLLATFLRTFSFNPVADPEEGGTISPELGDYVASSSFDVEATANEGWRFVGWEGDFTGTQNPFNITMSGNKTIIGHFERLEYIVSTDQITGQGSVEIDLVSGTETEDGYLFESVIELTAVPDDEWNFIGWEGDVVSNENPLTVTVDSDKTISAVFSFFDGGSGTEGDPYQISNIDQVDEIRNHLGSHFVLMNDIDASSTSTINVGLGFEPIGNNGSPFTGVLNGNGFEISGLTINRILESDIALFGNIDDGTVKGLTLSNVNIKGEERVGSIAGLNNGVIINCTVSGTVSGDSQVGGIAGYNENRIEMSESSADVNGSDVDTGGLAGINTELIVNSKSSGNVQGGSGRAGGLVGTNSGLVDKSSASGTVDGIHMIGGLAGLNREQGRIRESFATGNVNGEERVGGLVGRNHDGSPLIQKSYARGNVTGNSGVGGFAGSNAGDGLISECYATGVVTGSEDTGGFAGQNSANISISYWDTENTGLNDAAGIGSQSGMTGLTTTEMSSTDAEDNMTDFDWVDTWRTTVNYPELQWQ